LVADILPDVNAKNSTKNGTHGNLQPKYLWGVNKAKRDFVFIIYIVDDITNESMCFYQPQLNSEIVIWGGSYFVILHNATCFVYGKRWALFQFGYTLLYCLRFCSA